MTHADPTSPLRLLYVDDDPDIRTIVAMALRFDPAIEAQICPDGEAALAWLDEGNMPDLIVLDVMMPGLPGPELMRRIRALPEHRDRRVAYMTARARHSDFVAYRQQGAVGVVTKPFDPVSLVAELRALASIH